MGRPRVEIAPGSRFCEWTVLSLVEGKLPTRYVCRCSCGAIHKVLSLELRQKKTSSCKRCANRARGTHLESGEVTPEYRAWKSMVSRCSEYASGTDKALYFERGIRVCDEWLGPCGFESFLKHIGRRPSSKHSLDRADNNKGYEPGNVRWATPEEQQGNRRNSRFLTIDGEKAHLAEWARRGKIHPQTVRNRLVRGWSDYAAVFTPVRGC